MNEIFLKKKKELSSKLDPRITDPRGSTDK